MTRWRSSSDVRARGAGISGRPIKRRRAYHAPRRRRWLRLAVLLASLAAFATVLAVAGLTFSAPLSATPTLSTTTPSPAPFTSVSPQAADASPSSTRPTGVAGLSPQSSDTTATIDPLTGGPTITPQTSDATAVTTQPSGAATVNAQTATASPSVAVPTSYLGTFSLDTDADGGADTVHFLLADLGGDGDIDHIRVSSDDQFFGNTTSGTDSDGVTGLGNDEKIEAGTGSSTSGDVAIGTYLFTVEFQHAVSGGVAMASITSTTWFQGEITADLNADGDLDDAEDIVAYVLSDTDSDGLYDTIDLSTDDGPLSSTTFGENGGGPLSGQSPRQTSTDDDERITGAGGPVDVRLGPHYIFTTEFVENPASASAGVKITAKTRFEGTFVFDADADGALEGEDETIKFSLFDTDSDGRYDLLDAGVGPGAGGVRTGDATDDALSLTSIEHVAPGDVILVGTTYHVQVDFEPNPPGGSDDARITLVSNASSPVAFTGSWLIDADGDKTADDTVRFVLSDTGSDGVVDTIDLSIGDTTFGESGAAPLIDGVVAAGNDERIPLSLTPANVKLGTHTFQVAFDTAVNADTDDARITSTTWYAGTLTVDLDDDNSNETLDFVQVDSNSDGLYETLELDADDNGSYASSEVFTSSGQTVTLGNGQATLTFSPNPLEAGSVILDAAAPSVVTTLSSSLPTALELLGLGADGEPEAEDGASQEPPDAGEIQHEQEEQAREEAVAQSEVPQTPKAPEPAQVTRDSTGQLVLQDQLVIGLSLDVARPDRLIREIAGRLGGRVVGAVPEARTYQVEVNVAFLGSLEARQLGLAGEPGVEFVSRHYLMDGILSKVPETPAVGDEWNERRPAGNNWNFEMIRAPSAWDITTGSTGVKVSVIDGEFDDGHVDLKENVLARAGPRSTGLGGHGTHVAGTICADGNNALGIVGVSWECSLVLQDFGGSSSVTAQREMVRAVNEGARVVNMSVQWIDNNRCGTSGTQETLQKVKETNVLLARGIRYGQIRQQEILWVFAAGNECRDVRFASPASLVAEFPDNVVVVASVEIDGRLSRFSNFGDLVTVAAPGGNIFSTLPRECSLAGCVDRFGPQSGTSMAAPHVSGLAALMLSVAPTATARQLKDCIVSTAFRSPQGLRVINAEGAVQCAQGTAPIGGAGAAPPPSAPAPFGGS